MLDRLKTQKPSQKLINGTSTEEAQGFKDHEVLPAEATPLPSLEALQLVYPKTAPSPTQVPPAQNPYHSAGLSKLDLVSLRGFLQKFSHHKTVDTLLEQNPNGLKEEDLSFLKQSRHLQKQMVFKLEKLFEMMRHVNQQVQTNKEG